MRSTKKIYIILTQEINREAGSAIIDGKNVEWGAAKQIRGLEYGEPRYTKKYTLEENKAEKISAKLADIQWGAYLELTVNTRNLVENIEVISDVFAEILEL